jgi:predicted aspartyl protease
LLFKGFKEKSSNLYYIEAMIRNKNIDNTIIDFVVDTGSTLTIISVKDAIKLKLLSIDEKSFELISNFDLYKEKVQTTMGSMDLLKLDDVILSFFFDNDKCYFAEYFDAIYIAKPTIRNEGDYKIIMTIPSVLGIDILRNYKIEFSNDMVMLER